jgi:hypothetical protein
MKNLNTAISKTYDPYMSIIKSVKENELDSGISHLSSKMTNVNNGESLDENDISFSLYALSKFLNAHYGKRCIVLVDDYEAPYEAACRKDYYEKARSVMSQHSLYYYRY